MSLLLGTHTLLWSATDPSRLSAVALDAFTTTRLLLVSPVNAYELIYKFSRGKLPVAGPLLRDLSGYLRANQLDTLPISFDNAVVAGRLSSDHRDPFDRLLAAQALIEDLTLVSIDDKLDQFGIKRLW